MRKSKKRFNIDGTYNCQNDRIWCGAVWVGVACPVIIEEDITDHQRYIDGILLILLQNG
jgi:hypothetical protein